MESCVETERDKDRRERERGRIREEKWQDEEKRENRG